MAKGDGRYGAWAKTGFVLWAVLCLLTFVYLQFPFDVLKDRLEQSLSKSTGMQVSFEHLESRLPLGLEAQGVVVNDVAVARSVQLSPSVMRLFAGQLALGFEAGLGGGTVSGRVSTPASEAGESVEFEAHIEGIDAAQLSELIPENPTMGGMINGEVSFSGEPAKWYRGAGKVELSWQSGQLPLFMADIPIESIPFEALECAATMEKGVLTIDRAELRGEFSGTVDGRIRLRRSVERSRLNLTGELHVPRTYAPLLVAQGIKDPENVRFNLGGTISNPRLRMKKR